MVACPWNKDKPAAPWNNDPVFCYYWVFPNNYPYPCAPYAPPTAGAEKLELFNANKVLVFP